ncbi:MAG TPA: SsrA-binding protein SmpB [Methylomirabilota bacterium]|jgi:SsrA-binding protein|nr:SsrA-binding protein SmpB [Methylomirabilota bacterium]
MARPAAPAQIAAQNRKARHDYFIEDTVEAGIMLVGTEVKALRGGKASIGEAFAGEQGGELYLFNAYIPEYEAANRFNHQPRRPRKLLVHKREMDRLLGQIRREGVTVVPLSFYFNPRGIVKVELGLARGKRKVDKRAAEKEKDWKRDKARLLRNRG